MQDLERNVGAREAGGGWRGREVSSGERRTQRGGEGEARGKSEGGGELKVMMRPRRRGTAVCSAQSKRECEGERKTDPDTRASLPGPSHGPSPCSSLFPDSPFPVSPNQ